MAATRTPVALFVFNRPELSADLVACLRPAQPSTVVIVGDGPRADRPDEAQRCTDAVDGVVSAIDWDCDIERDVSPTNLGCGRRLSTGISGVLAKHGRAIFVEDDCRPDPSFFPFCDELLDRYEDDERIGQIAGTTLRKAGRRELPSYFFSRFGPIWGWASWQRAWDGYDLGMSSWSQDRASGWMSSQVGGDPRATAFWTALFDNVASGKADTWDIQWMYHFLKRGYLCAQTAVNLMENVGFSQDATHTTHSSPIKLPTRGSQTFPLRHPDQVVSDAKADRQLLMTFTSRRAAALRRVRQLVAR